MKLNIHGIIVIHFSGGENIDFDMLYTALKESNPETLLAVTKRAISTNQFFPRWFLQRYMVRLFTVLKNKNSFTIELQNR